MKKHPKYLRVINTLICMCILISHLQDLVIVANASIIDSSNSTLTEISDGELNESTQESEDSFNIVENNESNSTFIEEEINEEELPSQEAIDIDDVSINDEIDLEIQQEETESIVAESIDLVSEHTESRSAGSGLVQFKVEGTTTCGYNHNLYPNRGKSEHATYINSCYVNDALYLGEDSDYYYIYISGYEGKVLKEERQGNVRIIAEYIPANPVRTASLGLEEAEVLDVPYLNYADQTLNEKEKAISLASTGTVQSPSYYANEGGTLVHYITKNVTIDRNYSKIIVGLAPEWMQQGYKYYSYDGIYFYNSWQNIRVNGHGAINENSPFYNYYQYLSFRSNSNYNAQTLDNYTNNNGGSGGKLVNTGQYFNAVRNKYGVNGTLQYVMGIHESGWGKSSIAMNKNNLFGINATDSNPGQDANQFKSVEDCIYTHAQRYISWGYTDPLDDWRYFGAHVGNKGSGMNVKYASDPFWGEKVAGWYYRLDQANGMKDYNSYIIGVKTANKVVNVYSSNNTSSKVLYQTKNKKSNLKIADYPFLILGEEGGFYKVQTDTPIVNGYPSYSATYNWNNSKGYISKESINYTSKSLNGWIIDQGHKYYYENGKKVTGWLQLNNKWYYLNAKGIMQTGWLQLNNKWYYLNELGEMQTGWLTLNGKTYYLNPSGKMHSGWLYDNEKWYYFWDSGSLAKGWVECPDGWYYLNELGEMQTGWLTLNGKTYYLNPSGKMHSGWLYESGNWYYFWDSGGLAKGWIEQPEGWYYTNSSGIMQRGWQTIGGKKYYFYSSGLMASRTTIDGYIIDENGVATKK
ncbi:Putative endo-beta-N-acetylglucosaminidase precursor [Turicibacter sanguinis]|nr:Putative endo-beta-N-acetylglucosaminidase precursor [Turicibacter sanguinis]